VVTYPIQGIRLTNIGLFDEFSLDTATMQVIELSGGGERGKTSILDAIIANLTGNVKGLLKNGETEAWIDTPISGLSIRRKIIRTPKGEKTAALEVKDERGFAVEKPATYLETLFGQPLLRPMELVAMAPKDRAKVVMEAVGLDVRFADRRIKMITGDDQWDVSEPMAAIEHIHKIHYDKRADAKRDLSDTQARIKALAVPEKIEEMDRPTAPAPIGEAWRMLEAINARNAKRGALRQQIAVMQQELQSLGDDEMTGDLQAQIDGYEAANTAYQQLTAAWAQIDLQRTERDRLLNNLTVQETDVAKLEQIVKQLTDLPGELLAKAKLPVEGMTITGNDILIDGVPFDERGESMKAILCVKISMALAPEKAHFVLIDGAERMDPQQRQELVNFIAEQGFQAITTLVTSGPLTVAEIPVTSTEPADPTGEPSPWD
jgi:DNA repair exonuclease SbcCD ATPase subunit